MPAWMNALDRLFPLRYLVMLTCGAMALGGGLGWWGLHLGPWIAAVGVAGLVIGVRDLRQSQRSVLPPSCLR